MSGPELLNMRRQAGIRQCDAARLARLSEATLSRIETGIRPANIEETRRLIAVYQGKGK